MTQLRLLADFFLALPPHHWWALADWHLWAMLVGLGGLAALGAHHLIGFTFGFYRMGQKRLLWLGLFTLPLLLAALWAWVGLYLLASGAPGLVTRAYRSAAESPAPVVAESGRLLLAPAWERVNAEEPTRDDIAAAFQAIPADTLREAYAYEAQDVMGLPPDERLSAVLDGMGRTWLADPDQEWPDALAARLALSNPPEASEDEVPFELAAFVPMLLEEIAPDAALPRQGWEHIAGTRFGDHVLRPRLLAGTRYAALTGAIAVGLVLGLWFWAATRLRRRARPKAAPAPVPAKKAHDPLAKGEVKGP